MSKNEVKVTGMSKDEVEKRCKELLKRDYELVTPAQAVFTHGNVRYRAIMRKL